MIWEQVEGSNVDVRLWVRNLPDKDQKVGSIGIMDAAGFTLARNGNPCTDGLDVTYRFGE